MSPKECRRRLGVVSTRRRSCEIRSGTGRSKSDSSHKSLTCGYFIARATGLETATPDRQPRIWFLSRRRIQLSPHTFTVNSDRPEGAIPIQDSSDFALFSMNSVPELCTKSISPNYRSGYQFERIDAQTKSPSTVPGIY